MYLIVLYVLIVSVSVDDCNHSVSRALTNPSERGHWSYSEIPKRFLNNDITRIRIMKKKKERKL